MVGLLGQSMSRAMALEDGCREATIAGKSPASCSISSHPRPKIVIRNLRRMRAPSDQRLLPEPRESWAGIRDASTIVAGGLPSVETPDDATPRIAPLPPLGI